jgi:S1-C subfamily serine protease
VQACRCGAPRSASANQQHNVAAPDERSAGAGASFFRAIAVAAVATAAGVATLVWLGDRVGGTAATTASSPAAVPADVDILSTAPASEASASVALPAPAAPELPAPVTPLPVEPLAAPMATRPSVAREDIVAAVLRVTVEIRTSVGLGSGFFVGPDTIVTNAHVVGNELSVKVVRSDGTSLPGSVSSVSREADLAIVRVARTTDFGLTLRSAAQLRPGEEVMAIGAPKGMSHTVTRGIVSAVRRDGAMLYVQTDAAINPGNSGGPLVDGEGRVVGVVTLKRVDAEAIGLALAADHVQALLERRSPLAIPAALQTKGNVESSGPAAGDVLREEGSRRFEAVLAAMGQQTATLFNMVQAYESNCPGHPGLGITLDGGRSVNPGGTPVTVQDPECMSVRGRITSLYGAIVQRVNDAEDDARHAGVYPGAIRDLRRKYRLDWDS